jgi:hypothetical protein
MKFHKFRDLCKQYSWLTNIVDPLGYLRHDVKTMSFQNRITPKLKDFVRHQVDFITFRPWWKNLPDLMLTTQGSYETTKTLEYAVRCDSYFGGSKDNSYEVEWEIVCRVGDQTLGPFAHRDGFTLNETMIEIQIDHAKGVYGEGELNFDFIVKRITESVGKNGLPKMSIEIWQLPMDFMHKDENVPEKPMTEHERLSRLAYFRDEPMPPILPRMIGV